MYTREKEIRKLTSIQLYELAQILDLNDSWKKLMRIIPKNAFSDLPEDKKIKYNFDHERLIENASKNQHRMAAEILIEEWGTSGRIRPTLGVLLELLAKANLYRAADLVAVKYLNEPPPARPLQGPAAKIDITLPLDSEFVQGLESMLQNGDSIGTDTLNDNANPSRLVDNNIDYFEKYTPNDKRFNISPQTNGTDAPSSSTVDNNNDTLNPKFASTSATAYQDDIPMLSEFDQSTSTSSAQSESNNAAVVTEEHSSSTTSMDDLPILSALNQQSLSQTNKSESERTPITLTNLMKFSSTSATASQEFIAMLSEFQQSSSDQLQQESSSLDLPILSAFNNAQSSLGDDIIPNLSTLNVHDLTQPPDNDKSPNTKQSLHDLSPSKQSISSGPSTISSSSDDCDEDEEDISAPNLSILDQRSSNNDSSLTNVTANSEDNSFEISLNEGSTSYDNIPCLSALK